MPDFPARRPAGARRLSLLTTYPPKLCGLATFAAALERALSAAGEVVDVVRIDDGDTALVGSGPVMVNGVASSVRQAAATMSRADVAIVQHEYGIYGGPDGDEVLDLLGALTVPVVVILHTVPLDPTPHQQTVLEAVCRLSDRVVVMTDAAGSRLVSRYDVDVSRVVTIPHGAATAEDLVGSAASRWGVLRDERPQLLTWGLLGPGKGIEHAIDAVAMLRDVRPHVRYTVAGVTHPKVFSRDGDAYRQSLIRRSSGAGLSGAVTFDDTYRDVTALTRLVASASVVVLPYDSRDQVTSGVLVDAIAAGRPVVATAFPHAVELLSSGAGIVVPHANPLALAGAIRSVLTHPDRLEAMATEARRIAPSLRWGAVADRYRSVCDELVQGCTVREAVAM